MGSDGSPGLPKIATGDWAIGAGLRRDSMNLAGKTLRRSAKSPGVCRSHHLSSFIHSPTDTLGHRHRSAPGTTLPDGPAKRGPTTGSPKMAPQPAPTIRARLWASCSTKSRPLVALTADTGSRVVPVGPRFLLPRHSKFLVPLPTRSRLRIFAWAARQCRRRSTAEA